MLVRVKPVWSDIYHAIVANSLGDIKLAEDVAAVLTSIDNILGTSRGERVMRPEFGSDIKSMLFENMDSTILKILSRQVKEAIEKWEARVSVTEVSQYSDPDTNTLSIEISFTIKGHPHIFKYEKSISGGE
jgi:hypothetical protein